MGALRVGVGREVRGWARRVGPKGGVAQSGWPMSWWVGGPKISRFFSLSRPTFALFFSIGGSSRGTVAAVQGRDGGRMEDGSVVGKKDKHGNGRRGKTQNVGPPTLGPPTLRALHPSGPPPFGPPSFGPAPTLRTPLFWFGQPLPRPHWHSASKLPQTYTHSHTRTHTPQKKKQCKNTKN